MIIERWLYRLLDLKAVARKIFSNCRVTLVIDEPGDYGLPLVTLTIYTKEDIEPSFDKLEEVRNWWFALPDSSEPFVLITVSYEDFEEEKNNSAIFKAGEV